MHQPLGFMEGEPGTLVCQLRQSLYGLTPSARLWYDDLRAYFESIRFRVSPHDLGLFVYTTKKLYITTHIDDFKIIGKDIQDTKQVLEDLKSRFEIKEVPEFKRYLGINIKTMPTGIQISQEDYIDELVNSFGLYDAHPTKSPLDPGTIIDDTPDSTMNINEYQRGTGSLQYLATKTRPDISRAACFLAEFNMVPIAKY
jgi:Reverse transcriptase (RNA-dependent DNA polymerase).